MISGSRSFVIQETFQPNNATSIRARVGSTGTEHTFTLKSRRLESGTVPVVTWNHAACHFELYTVYG